MENHSAAEQLQRLVDALSLESKVLLLTGQDFWSTQAIPEIGLRSMVLSDGPSGVRGARWDERDPSLNLPSASALSSSWDRDVARDYGAVSAAEARRKGIDVVLGPTINIQRSPYGGRHFEAFSEDPLLTGELAAAYVAGVQASGVGATPKHYVANDFETERFTADVQVDERTLREVYLAAFEASIVESRAWLVMSAYNSVNGRTMTENDLLETPLNSEWGFDGVVVSDWTAVRSVEAATAAQDLAMPGPAGPWGDALVDAVREGTVSEAEIDRKVLRLLQLAARVGALEGFEPAVSTPPPAPDGVAFARRAAAEGMVLAKNDGILPIPPRADLSIALIGQGVESPRTQGGGSATVIPERVVSVLDGIASTYPGAHIRTEVGVATIEGIVPLPLAETRNPRTGEPGAAVTFLDAGGAVLFEENRFATELVYFGGDAPVASSATFALETEWTPRRDGTVRLGAATVGTVRIIVDGETLLDKDVLPVATDLGAAFLDPPLATVSIDVSTGTAVRLRVERDEIGESPLAGALSIRIGIESTLEPDPALIAAAARAAAESDVAIVVVGTNAKVESEGYDRTSLALPGAQDQLVQEVLAANPRTIVVVNAGSPVILPWFDAAAAVVLTWFGGQEYGNALADAISGSVEPGGRLPHTWPREESDVPVGQVELRDGRVDYVERLHVGYREWAQRDRSPLLPFGFGLGYASWRLDSCSVERDDDVLVSLSATVQTDRPAKQVVQVYASRADSSIDRPARWLVGWAVLRAERTGSLTAQIRLPLRRFQHWDGGWQLEPGRFDLAIGFDALTTPLQASIDL